MAKEDSKKFQELININEDACEFYESAAELAEHDPIKSTFSNLEGVHKGIVINLQNYIRATDNVPEAKETFAGQAAQIWGELMAHMSSDVDDTLVKHLEEAEDRCLHSMQDALDSDDLSDSARFFLKSEIDSLYKSHDLMRALKNQTHATA